MLWISSPPFLHELTMFEWCRTPVGVMDSNIQQEWGVTARKKLPDKFLHLGDIPPNLVHAVSVFLGGFKIKLVHISWANMFLPNNACVVQNEEFC